MSLIVKADMNRFTAALRRVKAQSRRSEAEIVNKALKDVAFRAASFTPKTTAGKIRGELLADNLLARLASASLKKRQGPFTRAEHTAEMQRILKRRTGGVNALRAGWIPAITKFGGNFRGAKMKTGGSASRGTAKPATISHLAGFVRNAVRTTNHAGRQFGPGEIGVAVAALERAIVFVTQDRNTHAAKREMAAALRRAKG